MSKLDAMGALGGDDSADDTSASYQLLDGF